MTFSVTPTLSLSCFTGVTSFLQESQIAIVENEIAQDSLSTVTTRARLANLKEALAELEEVIGAKNEIITRSDNESIKRNAIIERKQQVIDQFNKKLEQMISQAGVSDVIIMS